MKSRARVWCVAALGVITAACGANEPKPGTVLDEAMRADLRPEHFVRPTPDYFHEMDFNKPVDPRQTLSAKEVAGRNMWMVWTGGNDRLWDRLSVDSLGTFDLLKTISSHPRSPGGGYYGYGAGYGRHNRWEYLGLVNEPCFTEATGPDPQRYGLWLDVRDPSCPPDPFADPVIPVSLLTNLDLLGADLPENEQGAHRRKVLQLVKHAKEQRSRPRICSALPPSPTFADMSRAIQSDCALHTIR